MANCLFCYKESGELKYHGKCSKRFFGTLEAPELMLNDQLIKELAEKTINQRIAVTGVQPKLSVTLEKTKERNRLTIVGLWGEYIMKPQHNYFPWMPETEDLTMHLASLFRVPVCEHCLLKATDERFVYIAKRFDRINGNKIHIEDFCQLSGFLTENKYKGSYEKAGKLVLKYCTNTGLDTLNYFELLLFSYLTGNNDMHLKNFSLLYENDKMALSPAYDLLNVNLVNPKDDEELGMTLNGKKKKIELSDFILLAKTLQIPMKAMENSFKKFSSANEKVNTLINSSFLDIYHKQLYKQLWLQKQMIFDK
jgi:serine/threonine-protein kinase HipA